MQRLPILEIDDGTIVTETVAICRSFEELHPEPALFGHNALGKAIFEMWKRSDRENLFQPIAFALRYIHPAMEELQIRQVPEWGEINKTKDDELLALL